jgi:signal transduction histidine kinase
VVNFNEIVEKALSNALAVYGTNPPYQILLELDSDLPPVEACRDEMEQACRNIIDNALQSMPDGGLIEVRTALEEDDRPEYNESVKRIALTVTDNGPGIPKRSRDKIFKPFFSEGRLTGAGLGLSFCKTVLKKHRGEITFTCPNNGGTRFVMFVPVAGNWK